MQPITDEQISEIEQILLPEGKRFDLERKTFIKEFSTCDLQAVPGSGKTTVLLAKLLALEKQLPLNGGKGILVISHTNVAVEEIKRKLGSLCPKLFSYPNYIGTIQSFIDQFLAIPKYCIQYGNKPVRIDDEIYNERIAYEFKKLPFGIKTWVTRRRESQAFLASLRFDEDFRLCKNGKGDLFTEVGTHTDTYKGLKKLKLNLLKSGFLCYDDAYLLASQYINEYPQIVDLIKSRFAIVFVDEMQDIDRQQYDLLENLFYHEGGDCIYQRIGDRNQSIFNESNVEDTVWSLRERILTISGSNRLSPNIARIIRPFGLYTDVNIVGLGPSTLKPHIILYEENNLGGVLPYFAELVQKYLNTGEITNTKDPIKAIGWVGKPVEENRIFISNYHSSFNKERQAKKIDFDCLLMYLYSIEIDTATFREAQNTILNGILKSLRIQQVKNDVREYTKSQFLNELKFKFPLLYDELKAKLLFWCKLILLENDIDNCWDDIKAYLPDLLFNWKEVDDIHQSLTSFLDAIPDINHANPEPEASLNTFVYNGLTIDVTTVHAVKGETHSATLYMETSYYTFESDKCLNQLIGSSATSLTQARKREAAKMMYVGLSRATCFVCFAASKSHLIGYRGDLEQAGWEVVEI